MSASTEPVFFPDAPAASAQEVRIVIVPVPFDMTSTWGKGADQGPRALLEASAHLEGLDLETMTEVYREGIFTDRPVVEWDSPATLVAAVRQRVGSWLAQDKFCVVVGGEHTVTVGAVQAHADSYSDISVLQLDAHSDLRDTYHGSPFNHACVMARVRECCPAVQVGIRSMDRSELNNVDRVDLFFAHTLQTTADDWVEDVVQRLSERVYVTIDLDVLDSALMPSTGTPEPGGLQWYDLLRLLRRVTQERDVVGFDVVELCPQVTNKAPDFLAAKLVYTLLSYVFNVREQA
ncbi:agmatinase [Planctomycetota bacterium]